MALFGLGCCEIQKVAFGRFFEIVGDTVSTLSDTKAQTGRSKQQFYCWDCNLAFG